MLKEDMWKGKRCFIVGGGPSLKDFDWSLLKNELWIGINAAWLFAVPTISYTHDKRCIDLFAAQYGEEWKNLPCRVHKHEEQVMSGNPLHKGMISYKKSNNWSHTLDRGLFQANNAGVGALHLADCLGGEPIYLIGFDLKGAKGTNHFHDVYPDKWRQPQKVYTSFIKDFKKAAKYLRHKVINLSPDSALECFPKEDLHNVLKT